MGASPDPASLAELCQALQRESDAERRRLARSLHDSASQTLSAAAMSLSLMESTAPDLPLAAQRALADALALIGECSRELREMSQALFPPLLAAAGLGSALRALGRRPEGEAAIEMSVALDDRPPLDAHLELAIYRFVEQAVSGLYDGVVPGPGTAQETTQETTTVKAFRGEDGAIRLVLQGRPTADRARAARAWQALEQRARGWGGEMSGRRAAESLVLEARFPSIPSREADPDAG